MDTIDLSEASRRVLREWDAVVERKRQERPSMERHAQEIVHSLEDSERRLGKDLSNYKEAFNRL